MSIYTDVLLIVPLAEEFGYVKEVFPNFEEDSSTSGICPELPILHRLKHESGLEVCAVLENDVQRALGVAHRPMPQTTAAAPRHRHGDSGIA
jgi:hypothetical protein